MEDLYPFAIIIGIVQTPIFRETKFTNSLSHAQTKALRKRSSVPIPSVVLVPGMFRSGSTWCFNVVRELLLLVYKRDRLLTVAREDVANVLQEASGNDCWDVIIIKGHVLDDAARELVVNRSAAVIHSFRDPVDAIRSGMRAFNMSFEVCLRLVAQALDIAKLLERERHGCVIFHDDITNCPTELIASMADQLNLAVSSSEVASIAHKLSLGKVREFTEELTTTPEKFAAQGRIADVGFSYYDTETFFHRRHVSASTCHDSQYHISEAQLLEICKRFAGYVRTGTGGF